ncbi:hypothetical protein O3P69_018478 [Scylla paramamosain]|uniref:Uncharacterized protein n=1 Tax=Scylla paramamosain TaxID=85552 RepID=A0AAW0T3K0_SCYPA
MKLVPSQGSFARFAERKTYPARRLAHSSRNTQKVTTPSVPASVVGRASIRTQERKDLYISSDILKLVCEKDTPVNLSGSELGSETAVSFVVQHVVQRLLPWSVLSLWRRVSVCVCVCVWVRYPRSSGPREGKARLMSYVYL